MKNLSKTLSVITILATFASANNLTKNLTISAEKGLIDKQQVNVISISKTFFNYINVNADISNKTYRNYSVALNLYRIPTKNNATISIFGVYGYETFNARSYTTITQKDNNIKVAEDNKKHQIYLGYAGAYVISKNLALYNEVDLGTKAFTLKLGMQHNFTKHISVGAEISRRWMFDSDYDNTNNILFNISYTF